MIPGSSRPHYALILGEAVLITLGVVGILGGAVSTLAIKTFGRPRFLIPPRLRRQESQQADTPPVPAADALTASVPSEPLAAGELGLLNDQCYLASDIAHAGLLLLTDRRIIFQRFATIDGPSYPIFLAGILGVLLADRPLPPTPFDQTRSWPLADVRTVQPGRTRRGLTIGFADGSEERFVIRHRDRWLRTIASARGIALTTPSGGATH